MELYKKNKNISYYKYDMIINNNLNGILNNFRAEDKIKVLDIILNRLYQSLQTQIINTDNRSVLYRSNMAKYNRTNVVSIPIRELVNIKKVKEIYLTEGFKNDCDFYKKDEDLLKYECNLKQNLLDAFDRENGHINFYENKLNFLKRDNFVNENSYFFKFNFFFIFFTIIIIVLRYAHKKY